MRLLFTILCVTAVLLFVPCARAEECNDICRLGLKVLSLPDELADEFYKNSIKGNQMKGKGFVKHIRRVGEDKRFVVTIDCGNDVIASVKTPDAGDLKAGQQVDFEGTSLSFGRRRYIYSRKTYMIFEFDRGSVK